MTLQLFSPPSIYCKKEEGNIVAVEGTSSAGKKGGGRRGRGGGGRGGNNPWSLELPKVALDYNSGPNSFTIFVCGFPPPTLLHI